MPMGVQDNARAVSTLLNPSNWSNFVASNYADYAIGGPTIEMWVASWNAQYGNRLKLYTKMNHGGGTGYNIGTSSNPSDITTPITAVDEGYNNKIFFPYKQKIDSDKCFGYWLATPSANSPSDVAAIRCYSGQVSAYAFQGNNIAVRPLVHLKSGIKLQKNPATGVWEKAN